MIHISLDLETWGKRPGCDIRSIGAVVFYPEENAVALDFRDSERLLNTGKSFYIATDNPVLGDRAKGWIETLGFTPNVNDPHYDIHSEYYYKYPLHRDPETVKWWNDQSDEAQAAFENPVDLKEALERFTSWIINMYPGGWDGNVTPDIRIWANDPHFDVSILAEAYHAVGLPVPWHYRAPRSMKTATDLAGLTRDEYVTHGTAHNALDDAIAQAWTICKCYERLGLFVTV